MVTTFFGIPIIAELCFLFFLFNLIQLQAQIKDKSVTTAQKTNLAYQYAKINCNNISTYIFNNGFSDIDTTLINWGFIFPIGSKKNLVYQSGLILAGKIKDRLNSAEIEKIAMTGSMYQSWMNPGKILSNGNTDNPNSEYCRVFKVRKEIDQINLEQESIDENITIGQIVAQNKKDREEWRASDGAPFVDINKNGIYEPYIDIPGIEGASQTLWFVANDVGFNEFEGMEIQATIWGYKRGDFLDNIIFKKYKIINKNKDKDSIKNIFIGYWSDADIGGDAGDDLAGCDSLLQLGFIYNSKEFDLEYINGSAAYGSVLLSGPWDSVSKNYLSMSSFSTMQWLSLDYIETLPYRTFYYNFLRGFNQYGNNIINPLTGKSTKYIYSGNPYSLTGWNCTQPYDYRTLISTGPFNLEYGESKEIVIAQIATLGNSRFEAFQKVRGYGILVNAYYYENLFGKIFTNVNYALDKILPFNFILHQNYPNPFNPSTVINYQLSAFSYVTLKVYDLLGREVATLVDDYKQAGYYNSQFSIANNKLSSGVYYYTLKAGNYVETKKMVLIK